MVDSFYWAILGCVTTIGIISVIAALNGQANSVPPTPAFSKIITPDGQIEATAFNSELTINNGTDTYTGINGNTLTIGHNLVPYAQLSDLTTQSCPAPANTASNVTLNTNDEIYKITHSTTANTHEIKIQEKGIYQVIAGAQVGEAIVQASGVHNIWLAKNGQKIANSNIKTTVMLQVAGSETMVGVINWVGNLNKNDIIYFQQACSDPNIGIIFTGIGTPPATPSIIVSIAKVGS